MKPVDYANYKRLGLCVQCCKAQAAEGQLSCLDCVQKAAQLRRARLAEGLCPRCGKRPTAPGKSRCSRCRTLVNRANRRMRRKRLEERRCSRCGGEIEHHREGRRTCQNCGGQLTPGRKGKMSPGMMRTT